jgi:Polysaccharide pyruvyl transferase
MAFGLITYSNTDNLGDEIQSLAAQRFLPRIDYLVDREQMNSFSTLPSETVSMILNGWYCYEPANWPPAPAICPLLISMHLAKIKTADGRVVRDVMLAPPAVEYLKKHGPVGARDLSTLKALEAAGVDAYFSACMTLTLERPPVDRDPHLLVLNDLPEKLISYIYWQTVSRHFLITRHAGWTERDCRVRLKLAQDLLDIYARASCVVTTRLHCALPCLAMGTPVLLIDTGTEPERFESLIKFVHHCTMDAFMAKRSRYNISRPPANPDLHLPYRETLIRRASDFVGNS